MYQSLVSDEAACFSQQPSVCAQETINKEGISWTIAARLAPCRAWELEEGRRREGRLEEDEEGNEGRVEVRVGGRKDGRKKSKERGGEKESKELCLFAIISAWTSCTLCSLCRPTIPSSSRVREETGIIILLKVWPQSYSF